MKKHVVYLILFVFLAIWSCSTEELGTFSGDTIYISFTTDASKDSSLFTFQTYPEGKIVAEVPVRLRGHWLTEPRTFTVSAVSDSTTLPETAYELPKECRFSAGQEFDTIQINFFNNFEDLKNKTYRLFLRIDETETVKQGEKAYRWSKFYVSDKLEQPEWWLRNDGTENRPYNIVEEVYLGKYSVEKYKLFLQILEEDGASFDGKDMAVMKKYALRLKYWLEEFNNNPENIAAGKTPMWDKENSEPMQVPVAG